MKSKLIAMFLALFFASGMTTAGGHLSHEQPQLTTQSVAISEYGTLLEIFDANGNSRFGKLTNNGFQVSYRSKGKTKSISAVGNEKTAGLVEGEIKVDGQSATVTSTTSDHALEITTNFTLDEKTNKLFIQRTFRNISGAPLTLTTMREFVDPALASEVLDGRRLRAGLSRNACHPVAECVPPPPPCQGAPPCAVNLARLITGTNPMTGRLDKIALQWRGLRLDPYFSTRKLQRNEVSTLVRVDFQKLVTERIVSR